MNITLLQTTVIDGNIATIRAAIVQLQNYNKKTGVDVEQIISALELQIASLTALKVNS